MRRSKWVLWGRLAVLVVACAVSAGCSNIVDALAHDDRPIPGEVTQVPVQREAVVPALLPLIDTAGLLRFPTPNAGADEMPLDTALAQAGEFLFFGLNVFPVRGAVEGQRGAFIDLPKLVTCNRPQLLPTAFEPPPDSLLRALKVQMGRKWMIPLCGARLTPEVIVSIGTLANDFRYKNNRGVGDTLNQWKAYQVQGVRWEWRVEHMVTAEEAVNEVYAVTGVRAASLPELAHAIQINGRSVKTSGPCPVWRVALERSVRMAAFFSLRRLDLTELYVADSDCPGVVGRTLLLTPWATQPTTQPFDAAVYDTSQPSGVRYVGFQAPYRVPVFFESVVIEK